MYGTTASGGTSFNGSVFQFAPPTVGGGAWTETVLDNLPSGGFSPNASIVAFRNGLLYGTTYYPGSANRGSEFT